MSYNVELSEWHQRGLCQQFQVKQENCCKLSLPNNSPLQITKFHRLSYVTSMFSWVNIMRHILITYAQAISEFRIKPKPKHRVKTKPMCPINNFIDMKLGMGLGLFLWPISVMKWYQHDTGVLKCPETPRNQSFNRQNVRQIKQLAHYNYIGVRQWKYDVSLMYMSSKLMELSSKCDLCSPLSLPSWAPFTYKN